MDKLLIANRGEIACRIIRTARRMNIKTVAVYSEADKGALFTTMADEALAIGAAPARDSYLNSDKIITAAKQTGAQAIHPGYGFLSENAEFAQSCEQAGLIFIGPPAHAIRAMGLKDAAKALMEKAGVPVVPGYHGKAQDEKTLRTAATDIGYPLLIKAVAGGGGKGMRIVHTAEEFADALASAKREAENAFGDDRVLIEKLVTQPRHIEIQVFADNHGEVVYLFERDCSLQRRHQKVIEEAPAPGMSQRMREAMGKAACAAAKAIGYRGAGTVEFIVDASDGLDNAAFYFMEMNTRLQVEHPVTEAITGLDLVEWQIRVAKGEPLPLVQAQLAMQGHAIEVRLYAEDPEKGFLPASGQLKRFDLGGDIRIDTGLREGDWVGIHYDPMIAKLISHGASRDKAIAKLVAALDESLVAGLGNNLLFLRRCLAHDAFQNAAIDTGFIERHRADLIEDSAATPPREIFLLAVFATLCAREREAHRVAQRSLDPASPWHRPSHWRLNMSPTENLRFKTQNGVLIEGMAEQHGNGWRLSFAGQQSTISGRLDEQDRLTATLDGEEFAARVWATPEHLELTYKGQRVALSPVTGHDGSDIDAEAITALRAPMPGKILAVNAKAGEIAQKGAKLIVMEAMKMEMALQAPADEKIAEVLCAPGDQVTEGALLIKFEQE